MTLNKGDAVTIRKGKKVWTVLADYGRTVVLVSRLGTVKNVLASDVHKVVSHD